jgi:Tfp pilus assembly protein PilZ
MNIHDQRQEYRFNTPLTVFLELVAADNNSSATIVICQSLDISANGLRVITDRELPEGSILQSCVQLKDASQRFILSTEVKWSQPYKNNGEFLIGLALFESENTNIQEWKEFVAATLTQDD